MNKPIQAPVIAVSRHRIQTDGQGVTTLVCFHGCPLRCRCCLNPFSFAENTAYTEAELVTSQDGSCGFRGFYGQYEIEISSGGKTITRMIQLSSKSDNKVSVIL